MSIFGSLIGRMNHRMQVVLALVLIAIVLVLTAVFALHGALAPIGDVPSLKCYVGSCGFEGQQAAHMVRHLADSGIISRHP